MTLRCYISINRVWQDIQRKADDEEVKQMFAEANRLYQDSLEHGFSPLPHTIDSRYLSLVMRTKTISV